MALRLLQRSGKNLPIPAYAPDRRNARLAALGVEGKWAIHPSQIELANQVFTPAEKEVERARRILLAMEEAAREGRGAVALDGRLIDAASIRQAQVLVDKADQIEKSLAGRQ